MTKYLFLAMSFLFLNPLGYSSERNLNDCESALTRMGIWAHGRKKASLKNPPVNKRNDALFKVTTIGGGFGQRGGIARFSGDSIWIAGVLSDGKLGLWNRREQREVVIDISGEVIHFFQFSPDNTKIVVHFFGKNDSKKDAEKIQVYDVKTGRPLSDVINIPRLYDIGNFSKNGRWLLAQDPLNRSIRIFDGNSYKETEQRVPYDHILKQDGDYILGLTPSGPGGRSERIARVTNLETGQELAKIEFRPAHYEMPIFAGISAKHGIVILEEEGGGNGGHVPVLRNIHTLARSPLQLETTRIDPDASLSNVELSPDGNFVYARYSRFNRRRAIDKRMGNVGVFWDTQTGRQVRWVENTTDELPMYSADGEFVAMAREWRPIVAFNRLGTVFKEIKGTEIYGFIGNVLVTFDSTFDMESPRPSTYYFTDLVSGETALLKSQGQYIAVAPDGSCFFYDERGGIRLFEANPKLFQAKKRVEKR